MKELLEEVLKDITDIITRENEPQKYALSKVRITKLLGKSTETRLDEMLSKINIFGTKPSQILS